MYPHNFNIAFRWCRQTSDLLRDWLLLNMRSGVTADDQKTLHVAEIRQRHLTRPRDSDPYANPNARLLVGRIVPQFGAAYYNVINASSHRARADYARVTPTLVGRVHVL